MKKFRAIIVGPGNIFNKAYLPFILDLEGLNIVGIVGRSEEKLKKYKEMYNIDTYTDIDKAIVLKPDCAFVHTSTNSHYEIVKKLLFNNINVYVDKPLTDDLEKTKELVNLAMDRSLILTIGLIGDMRQCIKWHQILLVDWDQIYTLWRKIEVMV
ncbi:Gfo/Idh/MocA family protein [Thermoanaerobacterium thermosaccharolyticum]|uniref:Gfo/Idh/MocA family protein n=1 Tax=Thermoanaerobacterium thermosaccharolyticum TaxID=1517 RepID=UPI002697F9E5